MTSIRRSYLIGTLLAVTVALLVASTASAQEPSEGYWYEVQTGDTWWGLSRKTGVSVDALIAANPRHVHFNLWLYTGHSLWVPKPPAATGYWYRVQWGDNWGTVSAKMGVSFATLWSANPSHQHRWQWLYTGHQLWIPTEPTAEACPGELADYPAAVVDELNRTAGDLEVVRTWLQECGALAEEGETFHRSDVDDDGKDEILAIVTDPAAESFFNVPGEFLIIDGQGSDHRLSYRADVASPSDLAVFDIRDFNANGQTEVAFTTTTCGAHTCFTTIYVIEWDGTAYRDLTGGGHEMAGPDISFENRDADDALELVMHGGIIGSVGAGPPRARTELYDWDGSLYVLSKTTWDESEYLYWKVIDANDALAAGGFQEAIQLYNEALTDDTLQTWAREEEREELAAFSRYRLAVSFAALGDMATGQLWVEELEQEQPDNIYAQVARLFWDTMTTSEDLATACQAVNAFAESNPETTAVLDSYGYATPEFTADDVCPFASGL